MLNNQDLISIIIPAYNAEKYIQETIESVLKQTYKDWELLIINDGSTDSTEQIISTFLNDTRIKHIIQKNAGVSAARNNGIEIAKGSFICFLDADDAWVETNLEIKIKKLQALPEIDFVFSNTFFVDEKLNFIRKMNPGTDQNMLNQLLKWERNVICNVCGNSLIRKQCFDRGLRFDENLSTAADQDFAFALAAKYKGYIINEYLFLYRQVGNSMSRNIAVMEKDSLYVYKKAAKNKLFNSFLFKQKCFSNMYLILAGSWYVNGSNKLKGFYFILKSITTYPPNIYKLLKKIV